jgi:hypothetical protein
VHDVALPDRPTNPGDDTQSGPVRVRPAGKTSPTIRDPSIFTGPVTVAWVAPVRLDSLNMHPSMRLRIDHYLERRSAPYIG